jgi:MFS family permease
VATLQPPPPPSRWGVSRNVLVLGWVSFFTDIASEMIYPLLPLFLVNVLGAPKVVVGLIEGIAESTASLLKLVAGWLADRFGRNKLLASLGYGASALSRPLFALVTTPFQVLSLRFLDRVGKGIRTVPRDLIIAGSTAEGHHGKAYGVQRGMDTMGAVIGPVLGVGLLATFHGHYQSVFLIAAIPGFLGVGLLMALVRSPAQATTAKATWPHAQWHAFDRRLRWFIVAVAIFALGNSSNVFLLLRAQNLGLAATTVPLAYMVYNLVSALLSVPAGIVSDRIGRPRVLLTGYVGFALIYLGFAMATRTWHAWLLLAGYGVYTGLTEGVERAWVRDLAPPTLQGSAFGLYHFVVGLAALPASLLAGWLWDAYGPSAVFLVDGGLALIAIAVFLQSWRSPGSPAGQSANTSL